MNIQLNTYKLKSNCRFLFAILLLFSYNMSEALASNKKYITAIYALQSETNTGSKEFNKHLVYKEKNKGNFFLEYFVINDPVGPKQRSVIPYELRTPNYRTIQLEGIGYDPKVERQDPSNVIKAGNKYYVFTSTFTGGNVYQGYISYVTSTDGISWKDKGVALLKGPSDSWDDFGVLTPYIMVYQGKYYLYYTSSREIAGETWQTRGPDNGRHIGLAMADSPDGPWEKIPLPVLSPGKEGEWDSYLVDDAHVIVRNGQFWLYYKGGDINVTAETTQWGVAISDHPAGPFIKHNNNPLIGGHTVCVWPHREGVAALIDNAGPERHTVQWSPDGIHFQRAACIEHVHTGCGPYDPDAHTNVSYGNGITWGVAQENKDGKMYIVRFEVDCMAPSDDNSLKSGNIMMPSKHQQNNYSNKEINGAVVRIGDSVINDPLRPEYHFVTPAGDSHP
jgi:hypothetical protein